MRHDELVQKLIDILKATDSKSIKLNSGRLSTITVFNDEKSYRVVSEDYGETLVEPHQEYEVLK
jgi:hypothetical protein